MVHINTHTYTHKQTHMYTHTHTHTHTHTQVYIHCTHNKVTTAPPPPPPPPTPTPIYTGKRIGMHNAQRLRSTDGKSHPDEQLPGVPAEQDGVRSRANVHIALWEIRGCWRNGSWTARRRVARHSFSLLLFPTNCVHNSLQQGQAASSRILFTWMPLIAVNIRVTWYGLDYNALRVLTKSFISKAVHYIKDVCEKLLRL